VDDDAIRAVVRRLARPHPSGGEVVERAAIVAEGAQAGEIVAWIIAHAGSPEGPAPAARGHGLHGSRLGYSGSSGSEAPLRFVLPAGSLR
jgi:hypothetical protein